MTFRKLDMFPSAGEETPTLLGPLEKANLNHWITHVRNTKLYKHLRPEAQLHACACFRKIFMAFVPVSSH
jgi:hypothetical protein